MKTEYCDYCGEYLGGPVEKYDSSDLITCGKQECERWARDELRAQREEAHRQLDEDLGYW